MANCRTIELPGQDISGRQPRDLGARRQHVGFVFQLFNLIPTLTARERGSGIELTGRGTVTASICRGGLVGPCRSFPGAAVRRRTATGVIARALATDPDLLLADEPAGALDVATGRRVMELLQQTSRAGRGVIMVTHNEAAAEIADHVMRIRDGAIVSVHRNTLPADAATVQW